MKSEDKRKGKREYIRAVEAISGNRGIAMAIIVVMLCLCSVLSVSAVQVSENVQFETPGTSTTFIMGNTFTFDTIEVHSTYLMLDNATISVRPSVGSIDFTLFNFSIEYRKWNESCSNPDAITSHTMGGLKAKTSYRVRVNGARYGYYASNESGYIFFTYSGGYSDTVFEMEEADTPPTIISVSPANGATDVPVTTTISATFSDAMNETSAEAAFSLNGVTGTFSWIGNTMTFTPGANLASATNYTVTIGTGAQDLAGNPMTSAYTWSFTTSSGPDTTPPVITNVASSSITTRSATITWSTDESSDSRVTYGITPGTYTRAASDPTDVTSHRIRLTGLSTDTTYYYVVNSTDQGGNSAESAEYSFTTLSDSDASIITINVTPGTINLSESVTISGNIIPAHSAIVTLTFTTPPGAVRERTTTSAISGAYTFDFSPDEEGIWLANATWAGDSNTAGNTSETVSFTVHAPRGVGYAIIIAGGKNDPSQPYFDLTANDVYKKLLTRGFTHERIFYLNPRMEQDADGDGVYDVDRISSRTNVSYAINTWAQGNASIDDPLLMYMVDHGKINTFFVNGIANTLTASDLNNHLDNLTDATGCHDITVVYDACYSGSFIDELSRAGRVIVTSTSINASAIFDTIKGGLFSCYFFSSISAGKTIKEAFEDASNSPEIKLYKPFNITPLLDDNGDGIGHAIPLSGTGDGSLAASNYIGILYGAPNFPPTITDVIRSQDVVVNTSITLWAVVVDDSSIEEVYASIFEPNFGILPTNETTINQTTLCLEDPDGDGNYTASFIPAELGNYTLIVHATDEEGSMASPKQCIITAVSAPETDNFDTGEGTYPSISGIHNGTIIPSHDIIVHKLYTYPCEGTGGHTEYVKIENATWNATATWNGYKGDWHNISFNETFMMYKTKPYNYTIKTGSYPQILHESSKDVLGGRITCTEFTDANGRSYNNWIPAVRLEEV